MLTHSFTQLINLIFFVASIYLQEWTYFILFFIFIYFIYLFTMFYDYCSLNIVFARPVPLFLYLSLEGLVVSALMGLKKVDTLVKVFTNKTKMKR